MKKKCIICKKLIRKYKRRYCSLKCYKFAKKQYMKLYTKTKVHKIRRKISDKNYYLQHKNKILPKVREYYRLNKETIMKRYLLYKKYRKQNDIGFRILDNLRKRIWAVLKGISKSARTMELLGCNIEQLKEHLEKHFTKDMTWSNYGKWEIDHIKPCALFDLSKPSEQRKCFNYKNLQPLWAEDNLRKSNDYK